MCGRSVLVLVFVLLSASSIRGEAQRIAPVGLVATAPPPSTGFAAQGSAADRLTPSFVETAERPSYARFALVGTGIGTALGLAIGLHSYRNNNSGCLDCFIPSEAVIPLGAVLGATTGFLAGSFLYLIASSTPAPPEPR